MTDHAAIMGLAANTATTFTAEGAPESLVARTEATVIIPGRAHTDLWVHPENGDIWLVRVFWKTPNRQG